MKDARPQSWSRFALWSGMRMTERARPEEAELVRGILALRAQTPAPADTEALRARLAPQLAQPSAAGAGGVVAPGLLPSTLAASQLHFVSVGLGIVLLYVALRLWGSHESATSVMPHETLPPSAAAIAAPASNAGASATQPAPASSVLSSDTSAPTTHNRAPLVRVRARALPPSAAGAAPAAPSANAPEAELALLQRCQHALDRDPREALALAEQHAREHPHGVFAQEREILAIEALLKLGRRSAATTRAESFLRDYPRSPHTQRVTALLEKEKTSNNPSAGLRLN